MIVALEYVSHTNVGYASSANILLREINTEEEAFAEMRRFLEINHISSNVTYVEMIEECERIPGRIEPRHKLVDMYLKECPPYDRSENKHIEGVAFGIYYGEDRPRHETLGTIEDWGLCWEKEWPSGKMRLVNDEKHRLSHFDRGSGEWYNCVKRYLDDLAVRKAGGG